MLTKLLNFLFNKSKNKESIVYSKSEDQTIVFKEQISDEIGSENFTFYNSAWLDYKVLNSPDKKFLAKFLDGIEVGMGAPISGNICVQDFIIQNCNSSFIWSENSKYIFAPRWTKNRNQELVIIDIENKTIKALDKKFSVLELYGVHNNVLYGIDSPIWRPKKVVVNLESYIDVVGT